jgi:general secretion pathway protein K
MRRHNLNTKQRGIAVITAMLIASLVTSIASYLLFKHQMLINQIENHFSATQARWMSVASVEWSRAIMAEDAKLGQIDHLKEPWATKLPKTSFETGSIRGFILDEQAFFNLNNLSRSTISNDNESQALKHFITQTGGNTGAVDALVDWIDKDSEVTLPNGAEDNTYIAQALSYKSANQLLTETGNLSRVLGFTNEMVAKVSQYCVVLPEITPININTASAEVLSFAFPELTQFQVESIIAQRNKQPFENVGEFTKILSDISQLSLNKISANQISVGSHYFLVNVQARYDKTTVNTSALLRRNNSGWPQIIWKKFS